MLILWNSTTKLNLTLQIKDHNGKFFIGVIYKTLILIFIKTIFRLHYIL